jgi:hypothetical protein
MTDQMMPSCDLPPNLGPTRGVVMIDAELEQAYGLGDLARRFAMQADWTRASPAAGCVPGAALAADPGLAGGQ